MSKENKECKIYNFSEYAERIDSAHTDRIAIENLYEPQDYIIQRHLENMIATYGRKFVAEVIHNMALDDYSFNSKKVG